MTFDPIARARSLTSVQENEELYREWAATYDRDVFDTLGFKGSHRIADLLATFTSGHVGRYGRQGLSPDGEAQDRPFMCR